MKKFIGLLSKGIDLAALLVCLGFFLAGAYGLYDSCLINRQANDDSILKYRPGYEGEEPEKEIQGTMAGWLTLEGTAIDDPVMQGDSNFEYLNKNPYGEYALSGSIFLDARNSTDFSDAYSLVYGHHMENSGMFGDLDLYRQEKFFQEHDSGTLIAGEKERQITIMAVIDALATDPVIFSPEDRTVEEIMERIQETAVFYRPVEGEQLIAFSTCREADSTERTVVIAVLE